ncbi:hypothetical protein [Aquimarina agarivorans]|uniref:hypothetical protein n=1 Tax=Aquimarina agarivorans TaxID=980584 RepID=UPI000248F30E|nr:hypothetical protein [Aquimarina agarivorans]
MKNFSTVFVSSFVAIALLSCESEKTGVAGMDLPLKNATSFDISSGTIEKLSDDYSLSLKTTEGELFKLDGLNKQIEAGVATSGQKILSQTKGSSSLVIEHETPEGKLFGKFIVSKGNSEKLEIPFLNFSLTEKNKTPKVILLPKLVTETIDLGNGIVRVITEKFDYDTQSRIKNYNRSINPPTTRERLVSVNQAVSWTDQNLIERINQSSVFTEFSENLILLPEYTNDELSRFVFKNALDNRVTANEEIVYQPNGDVNFKKRTSFTNSGNVSSIVINTFFKDSESNIKRIEGSNVNTETLEEGAVSTIVSVDHEANNNYATDLIQTSPGVGLFIASEEFYSGAKNRITQSVEFPIPTGDVLKNSILSNTSYNGLNYPKKSNLSTRLVNLTRNFTLTTNNSEKVYKYTLALLF